MPRILIKKYAGTSEIIMAIPICVRIIREAEDAAQLRFGYTTLALWRIPPRSFDALSCRLRDSQCRQDHLQEEPGQLPMPFIIGVKSIDIKDQLLSEMTFEVFLRRFCKMNRKSS